MGLAPRAKVQRCFWRLALCAFAALLGVGAARAQTATSDAQSDAQDARIDAILATPGETALSSDANLFATAPGLEQQVRAPRFTLNVLTPVFFNSNAQAAADGGTGSVEISPLGQLSWAAPAPDLPIRFSANLRVESERLTGVSEADRDFLAGGFRAQYVDANADHSFSPYVAYAPRVDFRPLFSQEIATRHDVNVGFNTRINFGADFQRLSPNGGPGDAVWALGLTAFLQGRFREPAPASAAIFLIPSMSYIISEQWSFSFGVQFIGRQFDEIAGFTRRDFNVEPIATLGFALPSYLLGDNETARWFGRPRLDFQASLERNASNRSTASFTQVTAGVTLQTGWRF
ncbi:conserved hypothetical protein [Methylocella silvestris BL2]|uniref:Uncharacterized protein n=1 Tax=Methylocella silvestris (strain DSM 15510 / CIP 108128 / LMG 27833 / NCIMB 13906 / BL2) TaxID=395965 RepID=B8ELK6_METSB|nr:hypothetical protein [Methylocella silvestris]ACK50000.1 conserved hypothetical protein [Methylocella silvestris BL2]